MKIKHFECVVDGHHGVYMIGCYLLSLIPSPKRNSKSESVDHGLQGSNREKSESKFYDWY